MKRTAIVILLALTVLACATAQPANLILYQDAPTFQWDAITAGPNGRLLVPEDSVSYEVFVYDWLIGVTDAQDLGQLTNMGATSATELVLSFAHRSYWAAGVRAKIVQGNGQVYYSERIAWSNVAGDTRSGVPFLYAPLLGGVQAVKGLRDSGM